MNNYYRNSFQHNNNNTSPVLNFNLLSPTSTPSTPPSNLSLLNHESTFFSSNYAPPYMSSYPIYQPMPNLSKMTSSTKSKKCLTTASVTTTTTATKSHACPISQCLRRFKRLEHLKRHMRIHTLERPFRCSYPGCQKNFSRSDNLSQHIKTHQKHQGKRN